MKPASLWPMALAGVLGITVVANGVLLYTATRGDAIAVEHDYYRKSLAWDSVMAQAARNAELDWQIEGRLEADGRLAVRLTDAAAAAIDDARIELEGFALARAQVFHDTLDRRGAGEYGGQLPVTPQGLHELRFTIHRGAERFTGVFRAVPGHGLVPRA